MSTTENPRTTPDECPHCDGRGVVAAGPSNPQTGIGPAKRCRKCKGTGKASKLDA